MVDYIIVCDQYTNALNVYSFGHMWVANVVTSRERQLQRNVKNICWKKNKGDKVHVSIEHYVN
jgi:hypothetical protein